MRRLRLPLSAKLSHHSVFGNASVNCGIFSIGSAKTCDLTVRNHATEPVKMQVLRRPSVIGGSSQLVTFGDDDDVAEFADDDFQCSEALLSHDPAFSLVQEQPIELAPGEVSSQFRERCVEFFFGLSQN
eukprot:TRINITY_DN2029_c0_g2_i1.p1 TRINITY_DN2029_c0_g2~~TRINITY_DN2029_c0_g2_i1.p1  ORF type:complete len:129 (+),score=33.93 TRINITY_DN2029_c0_g2_i1:1-387(+)